jgi:hypothetical protein
VTWRALAVAAVALAAACQRAPAIASCRDDLRGVYVAGEASGAADGDGRHGERWMVLDHGATLEAYPLFPDARGTAEVVAAPRAIELERTANAAEIAGTVQRRYMQRAERCDARTAIHLTRCTGDTLELVITDPEPPVGFAPCRWPTAAPSRVVRWRRTTSPAW